MLQVAVVGCGYWGPKLIRSLQATPGVRVAAACDPSQARRQFVQQTFPGLETCGGLDELLDRRKVDAIWIATPAASHVALAREALEAGCHVLVEKPMATTAREASALVAAARRRGLILQTGHTYLHSPAVRRLAELMAAGEQGTTRYVTSERINPAPPGATVSVLWDLAVHDVAILLHLIGQEPIGVSCSAPARRSDGLPEAIVLSLGFPGGESALVHASWLSSRKTRLIRVYGSRATLIYDDLASGSILSVGEARDNRLPGMASKPIDLSYGPGEQRRFAVEGPEPLLAECEALRDAIVSGRAAPNDGRRALRVVQVLEAAEIAMARQARRDPQPGIAAKAAVAAVRGGAA